MEYFSVLHLLGKGCGLVYFHQEVWELSHGMRFRCLRSWICFEGCFELLKKFFVRKRRWRRHKILAINVIIYIFCICQIIWSIYNNKYNWIMLKILDIINMGDRLLVRRRGRISNSQTPVSGDDRRCSREHDRELVLREEYFYKLDWRLCGEMILRIFFHESPPQRE